MASPRPVVVATRVVREAFCDLDSIGLLRLRQYVRETGLPWHAVSADDFVSVLGELFPTAGDHEG